MELVLALLTILAPILSVGVVAWADSLKKKQAHAPDEELDEHVKQILDGNPTGLIVLSQQLERLHREAERKRNRRA